VAVHVLGQRVVANVGAKLQRPLESRNLGLVLHTTNSTKS
jgi:hypothetical protein